jgi:hypothetical protein
MKIKKAEIGFLKTLIIILLIFVMLLFAVYRLLPLLKGKSDREACRLSLLGQSATMILPAGEKAIDPTCKTYNIVFFEDRVEYNGETKEVYDSRKNAMVKKFDSLTSEIVNRVVAEELRGCWYEFLEGKTDLWSLNNFFPWSSNRACFACSEITFDSSVKADKFEGFYNYTKNTLMLDSEMTYYNYYAEEFRRYSQYYDQKEDKNAWEEYADGMSIFDVVSHSKCPDFLYFTLGAPRKEVQRDIVFDTRDMNKYIVFFVKEGDSSKPRQATEVVKSVPEGCAPDTYFAYVIPFEKLSEQCSSIRRGAMK